VADLTTVAALKSWLRLSSAADDTLLASMVSGVSAWIQEWLGRIIASGSYTDTLNGNGKTVLCFLHSPVTAVTSVTIDGVAIPARTAPGGSGFYFDSDFLYLDGYCFTKNSRQNVVVVSTAGFAVVPFDLGIATNKLCAISYRELDRQGLSSKGLAGEQTNFIVRDLPQDVENILQSYKRVVPIS
jgi:hypothetical protein